MPFVYLSNTLCTIFLFRTDGLNVVKIPDIRLIIVRDLVNGYHRWFYMVLFGIYIDSSFE